MYQISVPEARKIGLKFAGFPCFWPKRMEKGELEVKMKREKGEKRSKEYGVRRKEQGARSKNWFKKGVWIPAI
jgi:hypothetical protein